jgi:hypothetical protein
MRFFLGLGLVVFFFFNFVIFQFWNSFHILAIFLEFPLKERQISNSPNVFLTTVQKFAKNNFTGSYTHNHPPGNVALVID